MRTEETVTELLSAVREGREEAFDRLLTRVYQELHRLAERQMNQERTNHTLQPTALVHEAYVRLIGERERRWENRSHFLRVAAMAMRRVLAQYARNRKAQKRGGGQSVQVSLDQAMALFEERSFDLIALDQAIDELTEIDDLKARIVELRFFTGLTTEEAAQVLEVSPRTVERGWRFARVWLRTRFEADEID